MAKNILIIDDEFDDLKTMKEILEREGYETMTATNGSKALEIIEVNNLDLILSNINLPNISGYELVARIKERIKNHSKIAFISIVPEKEANLENVDGFVQKPFTPESLLLGIKKIFSDTDKNEAQEWQ